MTVLYNSAKRRFLSGDIDWDADTIRLALINNTIAYTPDVDTEEFVADVLDGVTAAEFSDASYGRQTLAGKAVTQDNVDDEGVADANDVTFTGLDGQTIQSALLYEETGADASTPADDPLIAHVTSADFPLTANGGDVTIQWSAEGVLNLQ